MICLHLGHICENVCELVEERLNALCLSVASGEAMRIPSSNLHSYAPVMPVLGGMSFSFFSKKQQASLVSTRDKGRVDIPLASSPAATEEGIGGQIFGASLLRC